MASPLGKLLGTSPIAPIQQHMQIAEESVQLLCELIAAAADGDWVRVGEIHGTIGSTAASARKLRREIRQQLPRGLLLAMPRPDLLELLDIQERIVDGVRLIARPIALRGTQFPATLQKTLDRLCTLLATASNQALAAIRELDEVLEQGFGGREKKTILRMLNALDRQVGRSRREQEKLFQQIGKQEKNLNAVDIMFFYQICAALDGLADGCAEVGEQLELLIA